MKQKIEWYKEVLELEPGSRVFFPLAKLLEADSQTAEAVATLRQGVSRHPDHIEARLLLIELLEKICDRDGVTRELSLLGDVFCRYPSFWNIWSGRMAQDPLMQDAALALRFFAAALTGKKITWASVIEQGLSASLGKTPSPKISSETLSEISPDTPAYTFSDRGSLPEQTLKAEWPAPARKVTVTVTPVAPSVKGRTASPVAASSLAVATASTVGDIDTEEEQEEPFSLRTRSMADVLAEQGDTAGALDIYQELLASAETDGDRGELQERINQLSSGNAADPVTMEEAEASGGDNTRLVTLLESLAQRLESRAR